MVPPQGEATASAASAGAAIPPLPPPPRRASADAPRLRAGTSSPPRRRSRHTAPQAPRTSDDPPFSSILRCLVPAIHTSRGAVALWQGGARIPFVGADCDHPPSPIALLNATARRGPPPNAATARPCTVETLRLSAICSAAPPAPTVPPREHANVASPIAVSTTTDLACSSLTSLESLGS